MTNDHRDIPSIFRLAKNVSKLSNHKYRLGAIIVKNGKPLSVGFNQCKTHPDAPKHGLHAEAHAIRNCGKDDLKGASVYVYRESQRTGLPAMSKPCEHCQKLLREKGFKWMYFSTGEYPFWDCERL